MNNFKSINPLTFILLAALLLFGACDSSSDMPSDPADEDLILAPEAADASLFLGLEADAQVEEQTLLADGLRSPVGVEAAPILRGLLVAEAGTGNNDGRVTLYRRGETHVLIDNFPSNVRPDGNIEGTTHLAVRRGVLWIVNGFAGKLYRFNLLKYRSHQAPVSADEVPAEDIRSFVFDAGFEDSNLYDIVFDRVGNAYITDSGANIVVERQRDGTLDIFTEIPDLPNSTGVGAPTVEPVPTGIAFDGRQFFVSAFGGFPFAPGSSRIYRISPSGDILGFDENYTTLIELEFSQPFNRTLYALQLGTFEETGFGPNSGALVRATPEGPEVVIDSLNFPNGVEALQGFDRTKFFVTSIADGTLTAYLVPNNETAERDPS